MLLYGESMSGFNAMIFTIDTDKLIYQQLVIWGSIPILSPLLQNGVMALQSIANSGHTRGPSAAASSGSR